MIRIYQQEGKERELGLCYGLVGMNKTTKSVATHILCHMRIWHGVAVFPIVAVSSIILGKYGSDYPGQLDRATPPLHYAELHTQKSIVWRGLACRFCMDRP